MRPSRNLSIEWLADWGCCHPASWLRHQPEMVAELSKTLQSLMCLNQAYRVIRWRPRLKPRGAVCLEYEINVGRPQVPVAASTALTGRAVLPSWYRMSFCIRCSFISAKRLAALVLSYSARSVVVGQGHRLGCPHQSSVLSYLIIATLVYRMGSPFIRIVGMGISKSIAFKHPVPSLWCHVCGLHHRRGVGH